MIALPLLAVAMAQPLLAVAMAASTAALPPCLDRHEQCHMWAQIGECEVAAFMALNCPVSCGHACLTPGTTADSQALQQVVMLGARSDERIAFPGPRQAIAEMHAGELHLVLRLASGVVLTFGDDSMGQLGSPRIARATPVTRRPPSRVFWPPPYTHLRAVAVGAGRMTSGALLSDGSLILFGDNSRGQCGVPPEQTPMDPAPPELDALSLIVAVPMRVPFPRAIAAFSLGEVHSLILTRDGELWSFGDGSFGATCNGTEPFHVVPEQFGLCELGLHEGERIVSLVAGAFHSTVLTSDDRVLVWGDNSHGQLGSSRKAGYVYSSLHEAQRRGSEDVDEVELQEELERAQTISEMTLPRITGEGFVKLTSRAFHSAAITDAGRLLLWGDNGYGQLGIEPANHSAVGQSDFAVPLGPAVGFFARQVALGELHSLALDNASRLFSFGSNSRHELHRMRGASFDAFPQPTARLPLAADETLELLAAGAHFGAVTSSHGHVYVWGEPPLAADPRSMYAPREHVTSTVAAGVSAAGVVTAAPSGVFGGGGAADGVVDNDATDGAGGEGGGASGRALGSEAEGALSAISEVILSPEGTRAVAVCAGGFHSAALSADGIVFTWGENAAQQLCRDSEDQIDPQAAPLDPPPPRPRGRPRGEQPDATVADESWVLLGCGPFSTFVHVRGEALFSCGDAMDGTSSFEPPQTQPEPPPPPPAPSFGGAVRIGASDKRPSTASTASTASRVAAPNGEGAARDAPAAAPLLRAIELPGWVPTEDPLVALSCGHAHTLALSRAGRLFSWGSNEYGQLGYGEPPPMGSPSPSMQVLTTAPPSLPHR